MKIVFRGIILKGELKRKIKDKTKKIFYFLLNPRLLLCFGIAWLITNGWSYILMAVGTLLQIPWMMAVAGAYLAFLWLPISPEKLLTVAIAIGLLRLLFPNDEKTLGVLRNMLEKIKSKVKSKKEKKKDTDAGSKSPDDK